VKSEAQITRADVKHELQLTRESLKDTTTELKTTLVDRTDSIQTNFTNWLNTADNRIGSIQKDTFTFADNLQTNLFQRVDDIRKDANAQLSVTNSHIGNLTTSWANVPTVVGARFDTQTNCGINQLCVQNLVSDALIDFRYSARDFSTASKTFNSNVPLWTNNINSITTSWSNTSANIDRLTKPRWYDRLLGYGATGIMMYRNLHPATNVVEKVIEYKANRP
jgi:hypothetical protein